MSENVTSSLPVGCGQPPSARKTINSWLLAAEQYAAGMSVLVMPENFAEAIRRGWLPLVHKVIFSPVAARGSSSYGMSVPVNASSIQDDTSFVWTIAFSPQDSQLLVSGSSDGTVKIMGCQYR